MELRLNLVLTNSELNSYMFKKTISEKVISVLNSEKGIKPVFKQINIGEIVLWTM